MEHIPENIKFLILKQKSEELSEQELEILDAWYNSEVSDHLIWYGDTDISLKSRMFGKIRSIIKSQNNRLPDRRFSKTKIWAASVAAMFIMCLFATLYLRDKLTMRVSTIVTQSSSKQIKKIILPDKTIVWLKGDSELKYPEEFSVKSRNVELIGEALFEVTKDKDRPFLITSGQYVMRVVGTSFNLKVEPKTTTINLDVLTGIVEVTQKSNGIGFQKQYRVTANKSLHTNRENQLETREEIASDQKNKIIKGTQYNMDFVSVPVEEIMKHFEDKFGVTFKDYTGEYSSCRVTANLTDQSLETSLKLLSLSINAEYSIKDKMIKLTGGGCF